MTRRIWLLLPLFSLACQRSSRPAGDYLPAVIDGGWKLDRRESVPAESAPEAVRQLGLLDAARGHYAGAGGFTLSLYQMTSEAGAFELIQKWRSAEGRLAFHQGRFFLVVESEGLDRAMVTSIVKSIEASLQAER